MRSKSKYGKIVLLLSVLFLVASGCVYYNTFFLAKKNYNRAEKLRKKAGGETIPAAAKPMYDKAIEKATKVLAYYPESDYVDDAIFLLGMCYLRTGDYTKALRKFNELLNNFPESEFAAEARYWRSVCLYYGGKEDEAVDSLKTIADEDPDHTEDAKFMLGELAFQQKEYIEAKSAFLDFLEFFPESKLASKAHLRLGQIEWFFKEYEKAAKHFEKIEEGDIPYEDYYTSQSLLTQCYIKLGRLDDAQRICDVLLKDQTYMSHWGDVELLVGDIEYARGNTEKAREIWEKIAEKYQRKETGAWAYFRLGEMYFDQGNYEMAKEMFDAAASQVSSGEVRELALKRSAVVSRLLALYSKIENADSLGTDIVSAELTLAEMYITELDEPDSAISAYNYILQNFPDDSLAPKAAYSIGWVYANAKRDYKKADSLFAELLKKYPESDYAVGGGDYFKSRGGSLDSLAVRNVAYYFVKAEEFWLTYNWLDSALTYYSIVIDSFPESRWVPKAMAAKAEILSRMGRIDEAKEEYTLITQNYAGTSYDSLARIRLGEAYTPSIKPKPEPEETTTVASAGKDESKNVPKDTTHYTYDNLPDAPRPKKPRVITLFYPEQEWSSRYQGRVIRLKIKIDPFGKVVDQELIMSSGNVVIDQAALEAAKHIEFDPMDIDIRLFNTWFLLKIPVNKPAREPFWERPDF